MAKLFLTVALACAWAAAAAQAPAGDRDDQFVATGCVTKTIDGLRGAGPQSIFLLGR
jgi:hypothetical protein